MGNYDFGYTVYHGSTVEWALDTIAPNSTVLEFGPFNGNLTKHLKEDRSCAVDIVELDPDAGTQAATFARDAMVGEKEGNIENFAWAQRYAGRTYDYIVFLDVLEHLIQTEPVLERIRSFLKVDGKVLLSLPNVAYNGIMLNLLKNQFRYTPLGLLDHTHVRFFAYESIVDLAQRMHYSCKFQALQLPVTDSEAVIDYDQVPKQIANYLREREFGNVYQYLVVLEQGAIQTPTVRLELDGVDNRRLFAIYVKEIGDMHFSEEKKAWTWIYPSGYISATVDLTAFKSIAALRIDPMECPCFLSDIQVNTTRQDGACQVLLPYGGTDVPFLGGYLFDDNDPQLLFEGPLVGIKQLTFTATLLMYDCEQLSWLNDAYVHIEAQQNQAELQQQQAHTAYEMIRAQLTQIGVAHEETQARLAEQCAAHEEAQVRLAEQCVAHEETQLRLLEESAAHEKTQVCLAEEHATHEETREALVIAEASICTRDQELTESKEDCNTLRMVKEKLELELFSIHDSRGWKLLNCFYSVKNRIFGGRA